MSFHEPNYFLRFALYHVILFLSIYSLLLDWFLSLFWGTPLVVAVVATRDVGLGGCENTAGLRATRVRLYCCCFSTASTD